MSFHPNDVIRRGRAAGIFVALAMFFLLSAFFRTQVLNNEEFALKSEGNRLRQIPIPAPRGAILDRTGQPIAENQVAYAISVLPRDEASLRETMDSLRTIIPLTKKQFEDAIKKYRRDRNRPAVIIPDAGFDVVSVLEEHRTDFPNLHIQATPKRFYPRGSVVGGFVGYIGEVSERELSSAPAEMNYKLGHQIGKQGLEQQYEALLRGKEGASYVEVDARQRVVGEGALREDPPVPGRPLKTTIDLDLQELAASLFADSLAGAIVAMDPKTGGILALHTAPAVDPNKWIGGMPSSYYASLVGDTVNRPLYNKAVQGTFPPGSTFKLATAVIGVEKGLVNFDDRMAQPCGGYYYLGNRAWGCWKKTGHGNLDLSGAIQHSCDVYFYQLGLKIGLDRFVQASNAMGFGKKTGLDLPEEKAPIFPPERFHEYFNSRWGTSRWVGPAIMMNLSIGQGENSQTVVSMARFYAALANGGLAPRPHFAADDTAQLTRIFTFTDAQNTALRRSLVSVVSSGTAARSAIQGVEIGGKTGTAQTLSTSRAEEHDHGWFVGFAPANDPKIVVAVFIWYGEHGSRAAPLATKMIERYLKVRASFVTQTAE